ncbi:MAG: DNA primase [Candidatus Saccharibacteria bacterium]|nr:DNA primase [Candidatus Saccharibacteria bacterium]
MDAVEDIKTRLSIEDVVSEYVQLKRSGRNYKGLSPFSNEKTPSFMVSPEKQIWHDFSSGKGGDAFSFVMEMEGLDFKGALELLARKAGLDLSQYRSGHSADRSKLKERLYSALDQAAKFYQVQFSKNSNALDYVFKKRKFTKEVALAFRLGYAPNTGDALMKFLKKQGFSEEEMKKAGLITHRYRGAGDMFRGRIMVPLMDAQGRVIGFTARLLVDDPDAPKYINTPQTLLYDKGRHVFGLHLAKEAIRLSKFAVVVEGNLDVIASHQAGIKQVVATAGTAMTESHLKTLGRLTTDIRIAFDQDKAGQAAAERTIPLASKTDVSLSIITIPDGKDPDDLIKKDPKLWEKILGQNQYALDWLIERHAVNENLSTAEGKRRFSDTLLAVVRQLKDSVEQDHYLQKLAERVGVSEEAMRTKLRESSTNNQSRLKQKKTASPQQAEKALVELNKLQDHLLAIMFYKPSLRTFIQGIDKQMLPVEQARTLLEFLRNNPDFNGKNLSKLKTAAQNTQPSATHGETEQRIEPHIEYGEGVAEDTTQRSADSDARVSSSARQQGDTLRGLEEYVKILGLQYETLYQDIDELELEYEARRLRTRLIEQYVRTKKLSLTKELENANETRTKQLLEEVRELDALLMDKQKEAMNG